MQQNDLKIYTISENEFIVERLKDIYRLKIYISDTETLFNLRKITSKEKSFITFVDFKNKTEYFRKIRELISKITETCQSI